ncbi:uncharacterized protein B0I36DRAFT_431408 [Microdochium trichocladiopsis]|uniref:FAD/NAD(P)-binding domain-containing protein n=1 Tax=Microdochium trichocladiopsis TaxID=1682393 RepID=A0A9P8Y7F6_9PEZI|nr:uncharacterized protein B0I36DRAFT_431408 [Microdochium trichocladiopsis]KAH7031273.1 hypothetical protein B0I36DRAFT_431408 [Microdochium trichocladiopsis]
MPTIVILGGAYVGVRVAHSLLKTTAKTVKDLKIILVSKNSHFYWNMASVRLVIPGQLKEEQYAVPIAKGFEQYPAESFQLIVGSAEGLDTDAKTVSVKVGDAEQSISYDHLVLATGSRYVDSNVPWKANGTYEELAATIKNVQERIAEAKEIVVAGAGATGIELAGEIAFEYGKEKKVTLLSGDSQIFGGDSVASSAANELKKLGVVIKTSARVANTTTLADSGKTEIALENGEKLTADLFLSAMGVVPNSEYIPAKLLNAKKFVEVDETYRVTGAADVWAAGDVVAKPKATFVNGDLQATGLAKNIDLVLKGKTPAAISLMPFDVAAASVGRNRGVGRMGVVKLFSFMVYQMKGKTLGIQKMPGYHNGSSF